MTRDPGPAENPTARPTLGTRDAAALDALVEAGFRPERVNGELGASARALAGLLRTLDADPGPDASALVDVTFARVLRARQREAMAMTGELTFDDAAALDAWVMSGYNAARVPASLRERARAHEALAAAVTDVDPDAAGAAARLERTLARVQRHIDAEERRRRLAPAAERRSAVGGLRLADLVSVAAVLLIGVAVVWPVLTAMRAQGQRLLCQSHLSQTAMALDSYARTHRDSLPVVAANLTGPWWDVGPERPRSNSSNLFALTRAGFARLSDLACPGNPAAPTTLDDPNARDWRRLEEVSYSYQIMFGDQRPVWGDPARVVVLADRSPVVLRAVRGQVIYPLANSPNHGHRGQHVLFTDGSTEWRRSPVLDNGDNIWLPRELERKLEEVTRILGLPPLSGRETPTTADDAFVGP